jgi:hypothetical protein
VAKSGVWWLRKEIGVKYSESIAKLLARLFTPFPSMYSMCHLRIYNNPKDFENILALSHLINIQAIIFVTCSISRYLNFNFNASSSPQLCVQLQIQVRTVVHTVLSLV